MSPPDLARNLREHDRCDEPQRCKLDGLQAKGCDPQTIPCARTQLVCTCSDNDELPIAVRKLRAVKRRSRAPRCHQNNLLEASRALEPCPMDPQWILVAAGCGSRLSPRPGGAAKPAGIAILKEDVMKAERRRRAKARPDFNVIIPGDQHCWSPRFRPPHMTLGPRSSQDVPSRDRGRRRYIQRGYGP